MSIMKGGVPDQEKHTPDISTTASGEPPLLCGGNVCEVAGAEMSMAGMYY
jgi:hypothetical protein